MNAGANAEDAEGIQGQTQKAQKLRRSRKRNTKIVWKSLEPVFMRVAGHKWLGRRMGAGCRVFCGFALLGAEEIRGRTQKAQRLRKSRRRNTKLVEKAGKQHLPAIAAPSQKTVIPAQAGIHARNPFQSPFRYPHPHRHSRVGGNPCPLSPLLWIPACAGMTAFGVCALA